MTKVKERTMHIVFLVAACMSILAVAMICLFMFANGVPAIRQIGFVNFIFGKPGCRVQINSASSL